MKSPYYQQEGITIYHGDCREVMAGLPDGLCSLTVSSPPYNMRTRIRNGEYTTRENSEHFSKKYAHFGDDLSIDEYFEFHSYALREMMRISGLVFWNIQIVTGSKEAVFKIIGQFAREIKDVIVWDKGHGQPAMHNAVINKAAELILIFEKEASAGRAFSKSYFPRGEMPDIWRMKRGDNTESHGATFPLHLAERAITGWSAIGETILDPFMGTGTSLLAARLSGRKAVGIEISEKYCELAVKRLAQQPLFTLPNNRLHPTAFGAGTAKAISLFDNIQEDDSPATHGGG
jgi:site-specific DNA-methyltransferase (adenine-specific)/modification methylase